MKIQNLKTKVIGPVLLLIPMMCGHLGDGHMAYRQSGLSQQSPQSSTQSTGIPAVVGQEGMTIPQESTDGK
jgi:hypothetical protein